MKELMENYSKADKLARDVLVLSRNTLLVNLRFLDMALSQLPYVNADTTIATDGKYLYYEPVFLLQNYKNEKENMIRGYLHIIMHSIFRHMFIHSLVDRRLWDLACDIAVEASILSLDVRSVSNKLSNDRLEEINMLKKELKFITAEKLYSYFLDNPFSDEKMNQLKSLFVFDDHAIWYMNEEQKAEALGIKPEYSFGSESRIESSKGDSGSSNEGNEGRDQSSSNFSSQEKFWKDVSERMQQEIGSFSNGRYGTTEYLTQNLLEVNREKYDYTSFLKKFAVMGEAMKINDDEFDYIFYTYGLNRYGNMPLIEPLEYKEVKRIKEFVIAIDTSGSVTGDLVQKFVQKTYNIMKSTDSFFSKTNIRIIQADDEIQEDVKITTQEEFDNYFKTMELHGFGGNNEVKLFQYIDNLVKNKEFTNLKGMIYLTDGYGIFPEKKPDYEVAFVFIDERYEIPEVPPWVIKLVLQKEDI